MVISRLLGSIVLVTGALVAAAGCESAAPAGPQVGINAEDTGTISLALTNAPPDATCLRITVKGPTVAVRSFSLTKTQKTTLTASGLPLGQVEVTGEAFGTACSQLTTESVATYVSDAAPATLVDGQTASIALTLHKAGSANISVDFPNVGQCDGTQGQWDGCRGTGCFVCSEKVNAYPLYFQNHPSCVKNDTCAGQFFTCNAACPAPTDADKGLTKTFIEAENGTLQGPLVAGNDAAASGGKMLSPTASNTAVSVPPVTTPATSGHATYSFTLPAAQTIKLWGRFNVGPLGTGDDSLFVRVDMGNWTVWNDIANRITPGSYAWDSLHDTPAGNTEKTWPLTSGTHILEIASREDGLKMDRFYVTSDLVTKPQ